jgi:DNA-binding MarR family transcriptional regulator
MSSRTKNIDAATQVAGESTSASGDLVAEACTLMKFYRAEGYTPDDSMGYLMRRTMTLMAQEIERQMEPSGLTNAQWVPLFKLYLGRAGTVAELARECDLDAGSMTRLLDRLEAKSLCRRVRSSEDRRVVNLELTDAGRGAAQGIPEVLSRVQNALLAGFTVDEWQLLKTFLRRMLETAQAMQGGPDKTKSEPGQPVADASGQPETTSSTHTTNATNTTPTTNTTASHS